MSKTIDDEKDVFNWVYILSCNLYREDFPDTTIPPLGITDKEKELLIKNLAAFAKKYIFDSDENIEHDIREKYPEADENQVELIFGIRRMLANILYKAIKISIYEGDQFVTLKEIALALDVLICLKIERNDVRLLSNSLVGYVVKNITVPYNPLYNKKAHAEYMRAIELIRQTYKEDNQSIVPTYLITNEEMRIIATNLLDFINAHQEIDYQVSEETVAQNCELYPNLSVEQCRFGIQYSYVLQMMFVYTLRYLNALNSKHITVGEFMEAGFNGLEEFNIPENLISKLKSKIATELAANNPDSKISLNKIDDARICKVRMKRVSNIVTRLRCCYIDIPAYGFSPKDITDDIAGFYGEKNIKSRIS